MKTNNLRWLNSHSQGFFVLVFSILLAVSCQEKDDEGEPEDLNAPVITVDGVTNGETLTLTYSEEGNTLDVLLQDETGLGSFSLAIASSDISLSKEVNGTEVTETIDVSALDANTDYAVSITLTDAAGNESALSFTLVISQEVVEVPYDAVYVLGSAVDVGWNIAEPAPLTQDSSNPAIFTYQGALGEGEFKFPTFAGDWCDGDWINAATENQGLDASGFIFTTACDGPDNKWLVPAEAAGDYKITIDLVAETITIEAL